MFIKLSVILVSMSYFALVYFLFRSKNTQIEGKIFIMWITCFNVLSSVVLFFQLDEHRFRWQGLNDPVILLELFILCTSAAIITIIFYSIITFVLLQGKTQKINKDELVHINTLQQPPVFLLLFLFLGFALLLYNYLSQFEVNFLMILIGIADNSETMRSAMTNNFQGDYTLYKMFLYDVCLFLIIYLQMCRNQSFSLKILHIGYLTCFIAFGLSAGEKGPIIGLVVALLILSLIRNENIKLKNILGYFIVFSTALILTFYFISDVNTGRIIHALLTRIFTGELAPAYFSLELFHTENVLLNGRGLPNPGGLFNFQPVSISRLVYDFMHPEAVALGIYGSAPSVFWIEGLLNFGYLGILFYLILFSILFAAFSVLCEFIRDPKIRVALKIYLGLHFGAAVGVGFNYYLLDNYLIATILIAFALDFKIRKKIVSFN